MDREIRRIIITCTKSEVPDTLSGVRFSDRKKGMREISCHYLITRNGDLCVGRNEKQSCNFDAQLDDTAIDVCLVGCGWDFTDEQLQTLFNIEEQMQNKYPAAELCEYLPQRNE